MSTTRSINLGKPHDDKLVRLAKATGRTLTETIRRALDLLEINEANRDKELNTK